MISARHKVVKHGIKEDGSRFYARYARNRMLTELIVYAVNVNEYHVAYEIVKCFLSDLLKIENLPIFVPLLSQMKDTKRYEAKVELCKVCIPLMKKEDAFRLMRIFIELVEEPSQNSILSNNVNPLRVGLMVIRLIYELTDAFQYSMHTT